MERASAAPNSASADPVGGLPAESARAAADDFDLDGDTLREECGVFGIFGHPHAAAITALGLHALQHRGQEAAGIVAFDGQRFHSERRLGLVADHFSSATTIERLPGAAAVGHVRYSTTGETILRNVQPLFAELECGRSGGRPQRQSHQRPDAAARTDPRRRDLPVDLRHRGRAAAYRALAPAAHRRTLHRGAEPDRGRLCAGGADQQEADRRARSARHPAAGARRTRRLSDPVFGDLRARHHRREIRARHRERRGDRHRRGRREEPQAVPAAAVAAVHLRIRLLRPARLGRPRPAGLRRAQGDGRGAGRAKRQPTPTSLCRCPIPASPPRSATPQRAACPSSSASSATIT